MPAGAKKTALRWVRSCRVSGGIRKFGQQLPEQLFLPGAVDEKRQFRAAAACHHEYRPALHEPGDGGDADVRVAYLTAPHPKLESGQPAAPAAPAGRQCARPYNGRSWTKLRARLMPKSAPASTSIHAAPAGSQWAANRTRTFSRERATASAVRGNGRLCRTAK